MNSHIPNLRYGYIGNPLIFYMSAFLTTLGIAVLSMSISVKPLQTIGKLSIVGYGLQNLIVYVSFYIKGRSNVIDPMLIAVVISGTIIFMYLLSFLFDKTAIKKIVKL